MNGVIKIGLLGLGTVGSGVVKIIRNHQKELQHQVGCPVHVQKVLLRDVNKRRLVDIEKDLLTTDPDEVINDPEIDVIVEVMGGIEEARKYILQALNNNKHVVTANKDLIALYGSELQDTANRNGCDLYYEASVAGGIPIIRTIIDGLVSDRIQKVMGIVNGTTNYILTQMDQKGLPYEVALKQAQDLGFAEVDPTSDVEGLDAARKMAILARLAFSMNIDLEDVEVEGIANVSKEDLEYGKQFGYTMKLIGFAHREQNRVEVSVQPTFLTQGHPLASVNNEYNAVYVTGEAVGETMFYGPGAGSLPTATSVVADIVSVIKHMRLGVTGRESFRPQFDKQLKNPDERFAKYFLRLHLKDEVGTFAEMTSLFAKYNVSFEKILQLPLKNENTVEVAVVTHHASLYQYQHLLHELKRLDVVKDFISIYRVEGS
jgi:homoserine dehydrogenase